MMVIHTKTRRKVQNYYRNHQVVFTTDNDDSFLQYHFLD